ncbi:ribonuclease III [Sphingomonas sp. G124]|jgi:ribonuclease-3|uniref:Ribonuclease 3 n=1 Tax=Sphingomonas cremea TaxID=2904799 RepID=A0A9X1U422_9SPHN|nr:ribonuclease III [Sphingomonas cremea]MCF2513761.1 ribonuclease III [Sphingomonas cremea]
MSELPPFIAEALGRAPREASLFERAVTHGSHGRETYERLEFLGDRVLGLVVARWLYERFPTEPEGKMSRRYNALVARETCAEVGRSLGLPRHIRLGKQAREDNAGLSDNVIGDVVEAIIGAIFLDGGLEPAEAFVRSQWSPFLDGQQRAPVHPKSGLQERAAERKLGVPLYELVSRFGPHHSPRFRVKVSLGKHGEAEAEGDSKQEAETAAAAALLEKIK